MPLRFLIDLLTGNLVLVDTPAPAPAPPTPAGTPIGLLLALTYPT